MILRNNKEGLDEYGKIISFIKQERNNLHIYIDV